MKKLFLLLLLPTSLCIRAGIHVSLDESRRATISNDLLTIQIDPKGRVVSCVYDETELIAKPNTWYLSYNSAKYHELGAVHAEIKTQTDDMVEVVYTNDAPGGARFSQGYILRKGVSGLYTYVVIEGTDTPESVGEARVVYRLDDALFHDGYVNEVAQGEMPRHEVMKAVEREGMIQDATFYLPDSTIYTKYNWGTYMKDDHVHGVMSDHIGVWAIGCSMEYVNGGPLRQDLTVHSDIKSTLLLQMFQSGHYGAYAPTFDQGKRKIYGPFMLYLNKGTREDMIADAKREAGKQEEAWPFQWFKHEDYALDRATVRGRVRVNNNESAGRMLVTLAQPSNVYTQSDGYIFWAETDKRGHFSIPKVRKGTYSLHAYTIEGENMDELEVADIAVNDAEVNLGTIDWAPLKHGKTLWRIGEADRLAAGFKLADAPRAYDNFLKSPDTLDFTIGKSKDADWFYCQRPKSNYRIHFKVKKIEGDSCYLSLATAATSLLPIIHIRVNGQEAGEFHDWENIRDGAIYRSAPQSGYWELHTVVFPAKMLRKGNNTIEIDYPKGRRRGTGGILWDCIKLEIE